ncbi:unnamed protein product [Brassicogethes aeneus]|uniref:RNA helicase n=1 Tax=Brassicogethes aeneus TaxID=1431903 RepID=A0A9P0AUK6_BRAAE|nr:unnamed protein product [Brassicogethes aeneus]
MDIRTHQKLIKHGQLKQSVYPVKVKSKKIEKVVSCPSIYESCKDVSQKFINDSLFSIYFSSTSIHKNLQPFWGKSFDHFFLRPRILKQMVLMGFYQASKVQEKALPLLLSNNYQTCLVQSQSGTGKTLAYVAAMLTKIDLTKNYSQILCIEPTGEMVHQTYELLRALSLDYPQLKVFCIDNDEAHQFQRKVNHQIVIAECGANLQHYIDSRAFDIFYLDIIVFDEADLIINKHKKQVILLNKCVKRSCQFFYFSATYDTQSKLFIRNLATTYAEIGLKSDELFLSPISQFYVKCTNENKYLALKTIYQQVRKGVVFVFTYSRRKVVALAKLLNDDGINNFFIRDDNDIDDRMYVYNRILSCQRGIIITTDLWARGIDLDPKMVINYDLPMKVSKSSFTIEMYLHRIGRTGRFGKGGVAITLVQCFAEELILKRAEIEYDFSIRRLTLDFNDLKIIRNLCL